MQGRPRERTSALVLRAWHEEGQELRARITQTPDVLSRAETTVTATGVEQICRIVCSWVEEIARGDVSVTKP
jgi:hypothetical protein